MWTGALVLARWLSAHAATRLADMDVLELGAGLGLCGLLLARMGTRQPVFPPSSCGPGSRAVYSSPPCPNVARVPKPCLCGPRPRETDDRIIARSARH